MQIVKILSFAAIMVAQFSCAFAQDQDQDSRTVVENIRLSGYDSGSSSPYWGSVERWEYGVYPGGLSSRFLWRVKFGPQPSSYKEETLYMDVAEALGDGGGPVTITQYLASNHSFMPYILSGDYPISFALYSGDEYVEKGLNLLAFQNQRGENGGYIKKSSLESFIYLAGYTFDLNVNVSVLGDVQRATFSNKGLGELLFSEGRTLTSAMLAGEGNGLIFETFSSLAFLYYTDSTSTSNTDYTVVKYTKGGDIRINAAVVADGQDVVLMDSDYWGYEKPTVIFGGSASNRIGRIIASTNVEFAKTGGAKALSGNALVIEQGASVKFAEQDQIGDGVALTFRKPINSDNLAGTLNLNGSSQIFGTLTLSRAGKAPVKAVIDLGENDLAQDVYFDDFVCPASVEEAGAELIIKNYVSGMDHIYFKKKLGSNYSNFIKFDGYNGSAGAQEAEEYWEYVPNSFNITVSPASTVGIGVTVTFFADTDLTPIQWQQSTDSGKTWSAISGANSKEYSLVTTADMDKYRYRCVAGTGENEAISTVIVLGVISEIAITQQPENTEVTENAAAVFTVVADGGAIEYQWQYSTDGVTWIDLEGENSSVLNLDSPYDRNGWKVRCKLSNALGVVYSNSATMSVVKAVIITQQPQSLKILTGDVADFYIEAENAVNYRWQMSSNGSTWSDISGANTNVLLIKDTSVTVGSTITGKFNDGQPYYIRCLVSNGNSEVASSSAQLIVYYNMQILLDLQDAIISTGETPMYTFSILGVRGVPVVYQIYSQYTRNGTLYTLNQTTTAEEQTIIFSVPKDYVTDYANGNGYTRITATQTYVVDGVTYIKKAESKSGGVQLQDKPVITMQPSNVYAQIGDDATFTVVARGLDPLKYQWQKKIDADSQWVNISAAENPSAATDTLLLEDLTEVSNGYQFRCQVANDLGTVTSNAVYLYVNPPVEFLEHPASCTVGVYGSATFTVKASGTGRLTYQWERSPDGVNWETIPNATSSSYSINDIPSSMNGYKFRCFVTDYKSETELDNFATGMSNEATLTVNPYPIIEVQPTSVSVLESGVATFSVRVNGGRLTYQWQVSSDGGITWTDIAGANSSSYTVKSAEYENNGYIYRCQVSNPNTTVTSAGATLNVSKLVVITKHAQPTTVYEGRTAKFSVEAECEDGVILYQWQKTDPSSPTGFSNVSGLDSSDRTANLSITATADMDNCAFRCVVSNYMGISTTSNPQNVAQAWLTVLTPATILEHPSGAEVGEGGSHTLSVKAKGDSITYQWQYSDGEVGTVLEPIYSDALICRNCGYYTTDFNEWDQLPETWTCPTCGQLKNTFVFGQAHTGDREVEGEMKWINIDGANSASLTVTPTHATSNYLYRCMVSNSGASVYSSSAQVKIVDEVSLNSQPKDVEVFEGGSIILSVSASGSDILFQWQKLEGSQWVDISGATSPTYEIPGASEDDASQYRCVVKNGAYTQTSAPATVKVHSYPSIEPENPEGVAGESVTLKVNTSGAVSYQWQMAKGSSSLADIPGATSATYVISPVSTDMDGTKYACVCTAGGVSVVSNTVTLKAVPSIEIASQPVSQTVKAGEYATFTVDVAGATSYQWQYLNSITEKWVNLNGETSPTLRVMGKIDNVNTKYRCLLSNDLISNFSSDEVWLHVEASITIDSQPSSSTIFAGDSAVLSVSASGIVGSYQWQKFDEASNSWVDISGATSATLTLTSADSDDVGQYRCVISNDGMSVTTASAYLSVFSSPKISGSADAACAGQPFTMSVEAYSGASYLWQTSTDGGSTWSDMSSSLSSITINALSSMNGNLFRCRVTVGSKVGLSEPYALKVLEPITIQEMPSVVEIYDGMDVTMTVVASNADSYQWYYFDSSSGKWLALSNETSPSITVEEVRKNGDDNTRYKCVVSNAAQSVETSDIWLSVQELSKITPSNPRVEIGDSVAFSVDSIDGAEYQWQRKASGTAEWIDIPGATGANYTLSDITASMNGDSFRCKITISIGSAVTDASVLQVATDLSIIYQNEYQSVTTGYEAEFIVLLSSEGTYQWQVSSNDGETWSDISGQVNGTYSFKADSSMNGNLYRCKICSVEGIYIYSNPARLSVYPDIAVNITEQPKDAAAMVGGSATFTVVADNADKLKYQWQVSSDGKSTWNDIENAVSSTYVINNAVGVPSSGLYYRCLVSNGGNTVKASDAAMFNVYSEFAVLSNPKSIIVGGGYSAEFTVEVSGGSNIAKTYEWIAGGRVYKTESITDNVSTLSLTADEVSALRSTTVFCRIRQGDYSAASQTATMTYTQSPMISAETAGANYAAEGSNVDLSVTVVGNAEISYEWYMAEMDTNADGTVNIVNGEIQWKDWAPISGATSNVYTLEGILKEEQDFRKYRCFAINGSGYVFSSDMIVVSTGAMSITENPVSKSVGLYGDVSFTAAAKGDSAYAVVSGWEASADGGKTWFDLGSNSNTLSISRATYDLNGYQYRYYAYQTASNFVWNRVVSSVATLTVEPTAIITTQPVESVSCVEGSGFSLSIGVNGGGLSYQWQVSYDGGSSWKNIVGATAATYSARAQLTDNGAKYRCVVISRAENSIYNIGGAVYSSASTIKVGASVAITAQPQKASGTTGDTVQFSISTETSQSSGITYQWQYYNGKEWVNYAAADGSDKSSTVNVKVDGTLDNVTFRCLVYSNGILSATSGSAWLSVSSKAEILSHPQALTAEVGSTAVFEVVAGGDLLSYQWQLWDPVGNAWKDISGANSSRLSIPGVDLSMSGNTYRCVVSSASTSSTATSDTALLSVVEKVVVNSDSSIVEAYDGSIVTLKADVENATSFQWYVHDPLTNTWQKISGATAAELEVVADAQDANTHYMCEVSNGSSTNYSVSIWLRSYATVAISPYENVVSVNKGGIAVIAMHVAGDGPITYKWQRMLAGESEWKDIEGSDYYIRVDTSDYSLNGSKYRCTISNGTGYPPSGSTATSTEVTLKIQWPPAIVAQPQGATAYEGSDASFTFSVTGETPISYNWSEWSDSDGRWIDVTGGTSQTLTLKGVSISDNGRLFRCTATNASGSVISNDARLIVKVAISGTQSVAAGASARFSVSSSSNALYQWQSQASGDSSWNDVGGETQNVLTVAPATYSLNGTSYRCMLTAKTASPTNAAVISDSITLEVSQSFADWAKANSLEASAEAIPFGDGISNIERYAFNLDASKPTTYASNPNFKYEFSGDGAFEVTFPVGKYVKDVSVGVMYSYDMVSWFDSPEDGVKVGETESENIYKVSLPVSGKKVFVKFKVE